MKSFYPKGNWVKWKSRIEESVESLIKWAFEKTVRESWQSRWASKKYFIKKSMKSSEILEIWEEIPEKASISGLFFVFKSIAQHRSVSFITA